MIFLVWILNLVISIFNAVGCGKTWTESKYVGGMPHFLNWCGAIMAAVGFTWCYMIPVGFIATMIPIEQDDGTTAMLLDEQGLQAFFDLGYLVIIGPLIGSGLAITVHSWGVFYRRRTFSSGAVAGYNTFAQFHNVYSAVQHVPQVWGRLGGFFKSSDDKNGQAAVVMLVIFAALAGILTTWLIISRVAQNTAMKRRFEYEAKFDELQEQARA